jgi:hypothetical protein
MTFDCANPDDQRFRAFGILTSRRTAFNPEERTLSTPCVERKGGRQKVRTRPTISLSVNSEKWQFEFPQSFLDAKQNESVGPSLTKMVALQFGLRLDHRWVRDPAALAYFLKGGDERCRDMVELSRLVNADHVCRNRSCINPGHMQLVPQHENLRRNTMHIDNTLVRSCLEPGCNLGVSALYPDGFNQCRQCGGDAPTVNWAGEQCAFVFA